MIRLPNETPEPEECPTCGVPEVKPEPEEPKEEDFIIRIPAKLMNESSSIQKMAKDLIERIKVEAAR